MLCSPNDSCSLTHSGFHLGRLQDSLLLLAGGIKLRFIKKKHVVLPKRFLLAHPLRLPLRLQDSLLLLAGTATWLGNPRLREVILAGASP